MPRISGADASVPFTVDRSPSRCTIRGKVRVEAGRRTHIAKSGGPSPARRYSADYDVNEWERFWRDIGRAFERLFKGK